jgi:Protein of Unknown function (DUF2784)
VPHGPAPPDPPSQTWKRRSTGLYAPSVASGLAGVAAAVVVVVHLGFLAYVVVGGFLALRRLAWLWPSIATTLYASFVTLASYTCPLTTLEKWLIEAGGGVPYEESFIAHYLHDVLYPAQYERAAWLVATGIALVSYAVVLTRWRRTAVLQPGS